LPIITLTTDFGSIDGYPGIMKGVILSLTSNVVIVDITHEVAPHNIRQAAFVLKVACRYFPHGTVHVAVVDPGVGSERRILAVRTAQATFVGPDNGVLDWVLDGQMIESAVYVTDPRYWLPEVSQTFHGRDIFAPVAAHLARGISIEALGPPATDWLRLLFPQPRMSKGRVVVGEVIYIDRFGNLITNVQVDAEALEVTNVLGKSRGPVLSQSSVAEVVGRRISGIKRSYAEAAPHELLVLVGSSGYLEVALRDGSAAVTLGARIGDTVSIEPGRSVVGSRHKGERGRDRPQ
jgi:hypothetical protein